MRKLIRVSANVVWFFFTIYIGIKLSEADFISSDPFIARMQVSGIMIGTTSFFYGFFTGRAPSD